MRKIIFILFSIFISSFVFSQTIVRLDNSRISTRQLDNKISQLMKEASVTGMGQLALV